LDPFGDGGGDWLVASHGATSEARCRRREHLEASWVWAGHHEKHIEKTCEKRGYYIGVRESGDNMSIKR